MKRHNRQILHMAVAGMIAATTMFMNSGVGVFAASDKVTSVLPSAGANFSLSNEQVSLSTLQGTEGLIYVDS